MINLHKSSYNRQKDKVHIEQGSKTFCIIGTVRTPLVNDTGQLD